MSLALVKSCIAWLLLLLLMMHHGAVANAQMPPQAQARPRHKKTPLSREKEETSSAAAVTEKEGTLTDQHDDENTIPRNHLLHEHNGGGRGGVGGGGGGYYGQQQKQRPGMAWSSMQQQDGIQICRQGSIGGIADETNGPYTVFCSHGGSCRHHFEQFPEQPCDCPAGYEGPHCEFLAGKTPDCSLQCYNHGMCQVSAESYTAVVSDTWDPATSNGIQYCLCPEGYEGLQCEQEARQCGGHHCYFGGTCVDIPQADGSIREFCDCTSAGDDDTAYGGTYCQVESTSFCTRMADHNGQQFCTNGGECRPESHLGCVCLDGYVGPICEFEDKDIDHYACTLPCFNGGICRQGVKDVSYLDQFGVTGNAVNKTYSNDGEHCVCPAGHVGLQCEYDMTVCPGGQHVCMNGADCVVAADPDEETGVLSFECDCSTAKSKKHSRYAGKYCEYEATEYCLRDDKLPRRKGPKAFCTNDGTCLDYVDKGEEHPGCNCPDGFEGNNCEIMVPPVSAKSINDDDDDTKRHKDPLVLALLIIGLAILTCMLAGSFLYLRRWQKENRMSPYEARYKDAPSPAMVHVRTLQPWMKSRRSRGFCGVGGGVGVGGIGAAGATGIGGYGDDIGIHRYHHDDDDDDDHHHHPPGDSSSSDASFLDGMSQATPTRSNAPGGGGGNYGILHQQHANNNGSSGFVGGGVVVGEDHTNSTLKIDRSTGTVSLMKRGCPVSDTSSDHSTGAIRPPPGKTTTQQQQQPWQHAFNDDASEKDLVGV